MLVDPAQVYNLLALSDERDLWQKLADQAYRRGFQEGKNTGFAEGYRACEEAEARAWRLISQPLAHPGRYAAQRLRNAEAYCKREADHHYESFIRRAWNTPAHQRTGVQQACVHYCGPAP